MADLQTRVMRSRFFVFIAGLQILPFGIPYRLTCPQQSHWQILSKHICPHARNYTCLLDILILEYRQNCKGPKIIAPGSKYIWQPNFNRGECDEERYQPFIFRTEGYTNCSFLKSRCYSEGQATFSNGSAKTDRQCYCDITRGYVFVSSTRHDKYCEPSEEDCSCHKNVTESITKTYKTGWHNVDYTKNLPSVQSEVMNNIYTVRDYDDHRYNIRRNENENARNDAASLVLVMLILMLIIPYPSAVFLVKIWPRFWIFLYMQYFNRSAEHTRMVNRNEEQTLDKIVSRQNMLTGFEKCVLLRYMSTLSNTEIIEFSLLLLEKGLIKQCVHSCIESCYKNINNPNMRYVVVKNVMKMRADLRNVVFVMYNVDKYKSCAIQLFTYFKNLLELRPVAVSKVDVQDRAFIQAYFDVMKKSIQKMDFENPIEYLTKLSQKIQMTVTGLRCDQCNDRIFTELCDKYIVLVALTIDALANKTNEVDPQGNLFSEIENIISKSSCPDLSRCMLYGRKAVALSFTGKQTEGECMVIRARECADNIVPCLETVDLYYKIVLFRRAWYENNPEEELKSILDFTNKAKDILSGMSVDLRLFWSRRFVVRLLFCYLGLGMRCRIIPGYIIRPEYIQESENLLKLFDSRTAEIRIQMFFYIAKARLFHLTGEKKMPF